MKTTPPSSTPKEKPPYAEKVRELRELVALTQPALAREVGVKRGTIAQWEGGTREPRYKNYRELAAFAAKRGRTLLADFFEGQIPLSQMRRRKSRRDKQQIPFAEKHFLSVKEAAATGDLGAERILKLSRMDRATYSRHLVDTIAQKIGQLEDWGFSDLLRKLAEEASEIEELRSGYRSLRKKRGSTDV